MVVMGGGVGRQHRSVGLKIQWSTNLATLTSLWAEALSFSGLEEILPWNPKLYLRQPPPLCPAEGHGSTLAAEINLRTS